MTVHATSSAPPPDGVAAPIPRPRSVSGLERLATVQTVRRRQPVYLPGDPAQAVYLVTEGRVKISNWARNGKEVTFAIVGPGDLFGELEALEGTSRETCAEALDEVTLAVVARDEFLAHLRRHPDVALELTKLLGARLRALHGRVEGLIFRDVPARIIHALQELSALPNGATKAEGPVRVRVTHQELANLIGCNRETVSAVLGQFRRRGLVRIERQAIIILDHDLFFRSVA